MPKEIIKLIISHNKNKILIIISKYELSSLEIIKMEKEILILKIVLN